MRFAVIRRTKLVSFSAVITFLTSSATPTTAPADTGIAAAYPGDKNIASDPAVILADDFESYTSPDQAIARWGGGNAPQRMRIATEPDHVYAGSKAVEFALPISTTEISCALAHPFNPTQDTLFFRMYQKYDAAYQNINASNHNGINVSAKYPGTPTKPPTDGTGFFLFLLQNSFSAQTNEVQPGWTEVYSYWPKQRSGFGDHFYPDGTVQPWISGIGTKGDWLAYPDQYPDFKPYPMFIPQRGRWYCYELMVKANTPGQNNGEVKFWIDGKVVGDFPDLFLRSIDTLKIDRADIELHATSVTSPLKKWHDNVVIATKYIGPMASPSPSPVTANISNISTRASVQTGPGVTIAGFTITGTGPKTVVLRGLGPALAQPPFNIPGVLADPFLSLVDGSGNVLWNNDNWKDSQQAAIQATGLAPKNDLESAIVRTLEPGSYTAILSDKNGTTGVGLVEMYDTNTNTGGSAELTNVSTRGFVGTGDNVLIGGFIASGSTTVVVRGLGPTLAQKFNVPGVLADPYLSLHDGNGNVVYTNNNWKNIQQAAISATGKAPPNDLEAALIVTVAAGNYTAILSGIGFGTGIGLLEVYKQ